MVGGLRREKVVDNQMERKRNPSSIYERKIRREATSTDYVVHSYSPPI